MGINAEYMGTHPIFESDFDCLTADGRNGIDLVRIRHGRAGLFFRRGQHGFAKGGRSKIAQIWLLGLVSLVLGELLTVVAYTNAPAILVSPLGALRVIVTTLLSVKYLKEQISQSTKIGIALSILGSILIVIH